MNFLLALIFLLCIIYYIKFLDKVYKKGEKMFKEWKAIFKKPKIIVVMLGVALIHSSLV